MAEAKTMEAVTVRPPVAADLPALADVAWRSTRAAFEHILPAAVLDRKRPEDFARRFAARLPDLRVAVDAHDAQLGFSLMTGSHLDMLFVDPAAQGRSAGTALLADAVARGCRTLESFAHNRLARRFYESRGFRLCRSYRRLYEGLELPFVLYALAEG
ncbi:GNAT family N-acetyltransferase [Inquilinus sp. Marseille-Q2685]|uniref:GNAT family N-acetyltransferase n=1 Tax=Inquilinus sp. Marseille-Q2685 TaxID=2866581 RepID=UPI001CE3EBC4|nr:GNAT family N-acetyltransferase [Inquilinus sp. Marseille-Q2685]